MNLDLNMPMKDFIRLIKQEKLSNQKVKVLLDEAGEIISKNAISDIYTAAGYKLTDARKRIFEETEHVDDKMTVQTAITMARSLRSQKSVAPTVTKEKVKKPLSYVFIDESIGTPSVIDESEFAGIIPSNPFSIERPEEARSFILEALGLDSNELESIKNIIQQGTVPVNNESIYDSLKQLGSRERKNKTYYISTEIIERVAAFTEDKGIRVSEFIEVALLEAIKKYQ